METIRTSTPQQLLLALPHLAGATIANSVVLLPVTGTRIGVPVRIDIPADESGALFDGWADVLLASFCALKAPAAIIVVVTDSVIGEGPLPHRDLVRAVRAGLRRRHRRVVMALCQGQDAWGDYAAPRAPKGPIAQLESSDGAPFLAPIAPPGLPEPAPTADRSVVSQAAERLCAEALERGRTHADERPSRLLQAAEAAPSVIEAALAEQPLTHETIALLQTLLQSPPLRDVATCQMLDDHAAGVRAFDVAQRAQASDDTPPDPSESMRMLGMGAAPDHTRLLAGVALISAVIAHSEDDFQPPLLTILGTLRWYLGQSSTAVQCFRRALALEPGYGMASLMMQVLDVGCYPEWACEARSFARVLREQAPV